MSAETDQLYSMVEKLDKRQDETNHEIRGLTKEIGNLVTILAKNELANEHMARRLDDCEGRLTNHGERIADCEKVQAGQIAERKLVDYVLKPLIGVIVTAVIVGALYAYTLKGG